jgi:hypothetical protein
MTMNTISCVKRKAHPVKPLDPAYLRECLDYNPETGEFRWKHRPVEHFATEKAWKRFETLFADKQAGHGHVSGYLHIGLNGTTRRYYRAHRVAACLMTGRDFVEQIDHINGDRSDNRWVNLRIADCFENQKNAKKRTDNSTGITGVGFKKRKGLWQARIKDRGRDVFLGSSASLFEAVCLRKSAELRYGYSERHGS